jgi:hypothetical protein
VLHLLTQTPPDRFSPLQHDRLTSAATGFLEKYVASLGGSSGGTGRGSGGSGGSGGAVLHEWEILEPRTSHFFTKVADRKFETRVEWLDGMAPGATMRWACVPGKTDGYTWRIPSQASVVGKTLKVATDSSAPRGFTVTALMRKIEGGAGADAAGAAAGNDEAGAAGNNAPASGDDDEGSAELQIPNLLFRWDYEGEQEERRGLQVAPLGARLTDDVFGEAILRGQQEDGRLLLLVEGEEKVRTAGHVYFVPVMPLAPTDVVTEPDDAEGDAAPNDDAKGNAEPNDKDNDAEDGAEGGAEPLDDAAIAAQLAALECHWETDEQRALIGTENTPIEQLGSLLDRMGVDTLECRIPGDPGRVYDFTRSVHGARRLNITSRIDVPPEEEDWADEGEDEADGAPFGELPAAPGSANAIVEAAVAEVEAAVAAVEETAVEEAVVAEAEEVVVAEPRRKTAEQRAEKAASKAAAQQARATAERAIDKEHNAVAGATLAQCLSGHFSHLQPVIPSPLLPSLVNGNASQLHGELIAFHWEDYGWAIGRLGATNQPDSNVSALYEGRWREQHTLFPDHYGTGDAGSWVLLAPRRAASPILAYNRGRYKKRRGAADVWLRADQLIHHTGAELAAAREASSGVSFFEAGRCDTTECKLVAGHSGLCSHLCVGGKRRRHE